MLDFISLRRLYFSIVAQKSTNFVKSSSFCIESAIFFLSLSNIFIFPSIFSIAFSRIAIYSFPVFPS